MLAVPFCFCTAAAAAAVVMMLVVRGRRPACLPVSATTMMTACGARAEPPPGPGKAPPGEVGKIPRNRISRIR
ncbi:hypothetical protein F4780DRAFT_722439 [Xylariomycetidae sp. FL0641]|nr:hypothetical protein F4780DRAFT_722439 [Xylariomycetidae sp. FL0641]